MDDKEKAKVYLQHGENIVDVEKLPKGIVVHVDMKTSNMMPTFEEMYFMSDEEKEENKIVEAELNIKVRGKLKEIAYLSNMKKCAVVPYPEPQKAYFLMYEG